MSNFKKILGSSTAIVLGISAIGFYTSNRTEQVQATPREIETTQVIQEPQSKNGNKKIQVVFALDATGSMGGLIGAAKEKIWSIASSFAQADSTTVEVGLVFYRDKGDEFVTKRIPLSADIDNVYEQLMAIAADGGGDSPESVNQGLNEAITKMEWSNDSSTFKSVFLVGDQPPHMDYSDDIKYTQSCLIAQKKEVVLNTILMGNDSEAKSIWKKIASCSQGDFIQVDMNANNMTVETPYDDKIAELSSEMDNTRMYYGSTTEKKKQSEKTIQSSKLKANISTSTAARRAEYNIDTKTGKESYLGTNELLNDFKEGKVNLNTIAEEKLPDEMAKMNTAERAIFLNEKIKQRDRISTNLKLLIDQRKAFLDSELKKKNKEEVENSFDYTIYENVKKQAAKKKINLKGKAKL